MKQQFVPLEKRSKQQKKEYYASQRRDWGDLNPVTRRPANPKAYNRRKSGQWNECEPCPDFFVA